MLSKADERIEPRYLFLSELHVKPVFNCKDNLHCFIRVAGHDDLITAFPLLFPGYTTLNPLPDDKRCLTPISVLRIPALVREKALSMFKEGAVFANSVQSICAF
jgi:hypothetical protein